MRHAKPNLFQTIKENFRFSTGSFLFILAYVNFFPVFFGSENTIVGVIVTIIMSASMVRDYTAAPWKHLFLQSLVLVYMALAAHGVTVLSQPLSLLLNFITILLILYAFTSEYSSHMYFPYLLSYLFLIFLAPVSTSQLPRRLLGMSAGAGSILLYQWLMGRNRVKETVRKQLSDMVNDILSLIQYKQKKIGEKPDLSQTHRRLFLLSRTVYERRKKIFCISDASFAMIDAGRGLEHLITLIDQLPEDVNGKEQILLGQISSQLKEFQSYLRQEIPDLSPISGLNAETDTKSFTPTMINIRDRLIHMSSPQAKTRCRKTALSLKIRILAVLDFSPVRAIYAGRVALLLACATALVQYWSLPYGKWFLFTLASVSLPYADDIPLKMKRRCLATIIGGAFSFFFYALVPSAAARSAAMMLSGYFSFYFSGYTGTFACSTVGALGGAVSSQAFGFLAVGRIVLIRLGAILAGIAVAYAVNCLLFPYSRAQATKALWKKYKAASKFLAKVCLEKQMDPQIYRHLVVQTYMLEEKLTQNADLEQWAEFPSLLAQCRERIRMAHWMRRTGMPIHTGA